MPVISTGKYLKRESVTAEGEVHKVIKCVEEEINSSDGGSETKWILYLSDLKPLIMNATNIRRCLAAFGGDSETDNWHGRQIVVYDDDSVEFGGKVVGGVRLRAVPAKSKSKAKSKKATDEDEMPF
tara:strand:+ start:61 stop:438 length:378 start_codon:yes stop_codon:yes gene_type:complete